MVSPNGVFGGMVMLYCIANRGDHIAVREVFLCCLLFGAMRSLHRYLALYNVDNLVIDSLSQH